MITNILLLLLSIGFAYILWVGIHEISHMVMAKILLQGSNFELHLLPSYHLDRGWVFGYCRCRYSIDASTWKQGVFFLAPRIPNILAAIALQFVYPTTMASLALVIIIGAGLIDLIVGSLGISPISDLQRASTLFNISPWYLRIGGSLVFVASVAGLLWPPC